MTKPACSILIPTYNCLTYLPTALASVTMQRSLACEIIVINDGSSDGTAEWLRDATRTVANLRVVDTDGIGASKARNAGIAIASAPYIAFLDADDWWWPDKLAPQVAFLAANPDVAFSFTDYLHVSTQSENLGTCFDFWKSEALRRRDASYYRLNDPLSSLLATNIVGTSTVVASKAALEKANGFARIGSAEDWDLWLRLSENHSAACSKAITATYLMRPGSVTADREARIAVMDYIIARYHNHPRAVVRRAAASARTRAHVARAEYARQTGRHHAAARYHSLAFLSHPSTRHGKAATSSILNAALQLVSGHGTGK